jgi:hypothetical protein
MRFGKHGTKAGELVSTKERTVFIINAEKLDDFLYEFSVVDR